MKLNKDDLIKVLTVMQINTDNVVELQRKNMQLESDLFHQQWKFRYVSRRLKELAPDEAISELRKIERKSKKNTSPGQQTLTKEQMFSTTEPLNLDINLFNIPAPDPELERQSKEVEQMIRENDNKRKGGLAALLNVDPKKI